KRIKCTYLWRRTSKKLRGKCGKKKTAYFRSGFFINRSCSCCFWNNRFCWSRHPAFSSFIVGTRSSPSSAIINVGWGGIPYLNRLSRENDYSTCGTTNRCHYSINWRSGICGYFSKKKNGKKRISHATCEKSIRGLSWT